MENTNLPDLTTNPSSLHDALQATEMPATSEELVQYLLKVASLGMDTIEKLEDEYREPPDPEKYKKLIKNLEKQLCKLVWR